MVQGKREDLENLEHILLYYFFHTEMLAVAPEVRRQLMENIDQS
jgi:hypothetical protein